MNGMTTKVLFSLVDVPETNGKMRIIHRTTGDIA
jgi:hypothetical protein